MPITTCHARARVGQGQQDLQFVSFSLEGVDYGVDVADVYGIYHGLPLIPNPDGAPFLDGEVQLADRRIPILNLRRFAGMPAISDPNSPRWVVMVNRSSGPIGLVVDQVSEVLRVKAQNLEYTTDNSNNPVGDYIVAVATGHGRPLYLPDFSRLIQDAIL